MIYIHIWMHNFWKAHEDELLKWAAFMWFVRDSALAGTAFILCFNALYKCSTSITNQPTKVTYERCWLTIIVGADVDMCLNLNASRKVRHFGITCDTGSVNTGQWCRIIYQQKNAFAFVNQIQATSQGHTIKYNNRQWGNHPWMK